MPFLPDLPTRESSTLNTQAFLGLNRGKSIGDGEMADMLNMTGEDYPVLSVRKGRGRPPIPANGLTQYPAKIDGMAASDKLIICSGGYVYLDGIKTALTISAEEHKNPKRIAVMGVYAYIWPDKKYINLQNPSEYGDMGQVWQPVEDAYISATMCRKDGTAYDLDPANISPTAPAEPENMELWLDTSADVSVLKQYSSTYQVWVQVATTYINIRADGIGKGLKEGDAVYISGAKIDKEITADPEPVPPTPDPPTPTSATKTFTADADVSLWCSFTASTNGNSAYTREPSQTKVIKVSDIPDGATITGAKLTYTLTSPMWGIKLLTCNGQDIAPTADEGETIQWPYDGEMPVEVIGNGDMSFAFRFLCNKDWASTPGSHSGTINIQDIKLVVDYTTVMGTAGRGDNDDAKQIEALNTYNHVYGCSDNSIIVAGLLHHALQLSNTIKCEMRIPDLDYVCEANNRLWGCSYISVDGTLTNEIRCCALGDHRNWYRFEGTSMDSYVMSIGSAGAFTAAISLQGTPLFFKADCMHKISGTMPSNYALNTVKCRGVEVGCWRSLAIVNETLYYQGKTDVMAYDGSVPYSVGAKLGASKTLSATAGAYRDKYYISRLTDEEGYRTYVYDTARGIWHIEDDAEIPWMAAYQGQLVTATNTSDGGNIMSIGSDTTTDGKLKWSATFGVLGYAYERAKYLSRFNIRAKMDRDALMQFEIMYDSNGEWINMGTMHAKTTRTFMLPVIPRRCDHCQIRLSGEGNVSIFSIARVFTEGGN